MSKVELANCKRCKKLYQRIAREICVECIELEQQEFRVLYRALQSSASQGGISAEDLSQQVGMPVEEIESLYESGRLGTAAVLLKSKCATCGMMMTELQRRGRFCYTCADDAAKQAGVTIRNLKDINKEDADSKRKEEQIASLKKNQPNPKTQGPRFGMTRHPH